MPLQATSGAASYDAFGGGVPVVPQYIEEVFNTWVATSSGRVVNGLDFLGKGGLVWAKQRNGGGSNLLVDTLRGGGNFLSSDSTSAQTFVSTIIPTFYNDGFDTGSFVATESFAFWTFRKQPKFFDVVTYTGDGNSDRDIPHNLGSVPGCIIVKRTNSSSQWGIYHRSLSSTGGYQYNLFFTTGAEANNQIFADSTQQTSTNFRLGTSNLGIVNNLGDTYVAYIFAHDAGGFGLTGTDNVISCGSFTQPSSGDATITLGYEPQWVLIKRSDATSNWFMYDTMRSMSLTNDAELLANTSAAEGLLGGGYVYPTATGFVSVNGNFSAGTYIYIAIRRGPMKVPTSGTSVFLPTTYTGNGSTQTITTNFPVDFSLFINRTKSSFDNNNVFDRLRGGTRYLTTNVTDAESSLGSAIAPLYDSNTGVNLQAATITNGSSASIIVENFRRAPSFMDVVCYTGTGSATTFTHNLGVVPELMIVKTRTESGRGWAVYAAPLGATKWLRLELTNAEATASTLWNNTAPTSSVFTVGTSAWTNNNTQSFVNYLFATCAGVSKVGSYTGNGSSQTINCGFAGGARFVMIKATSTTGDWMVADSARGIVSGNDPYLELNNTNAEVTGEDWLDTDSTGFVVNEVSGSNANTNGATYIFLAIA